METMEKEFRGMFHDIQVKDINSAEEMKIEVSKTIIQEVTPDEI